MTYGGKLAGLMGCYICDQPTDSRCKSCGHGYCVSHGQELCQHCLDLQGSVPSTAVFRASLIALFATTLLALWFLINPPDRPGKLSSMASSALLGDTSAEEADRTGEPALSAGASPVLTPLPFVRTTQTATPTATATATATATPTATPTPYVEYSVKQGDTIYGIAERFGVSAEDIIRLNNLSDPSKLALGQKILIPR